MTDWRRWRPAIGSSPDRLATIVADPAESSFGSRRRLAEHLGQEQAQLFPTWRSFDAAVERGLAARVEQGLPEKVSDPTVLAKAAAIFNSARRETGPGVP